MSFRSFSNVDILQLKYVLSIATTMHEHPNLCVLLYDCVMLPQPLSLSVLKVMSKYVADKYDEARW